MFLLIDRKLFFFEDMNETEENPWRLIRMLIVHVYPPMIASSPCPPMVIGSCWFWGPRTRPSPTINQHLTTNFPSPLTRGWQCTCATQPFPPSLWQRRAVVATGVTGVRWVHWRVLTGGSSTHVGDITYGLRHEFLLLTCLLLVGCMKLFITLVVCHVCGVPKIVYPKSTRIDDYEPLWTVVNHYEPLQIKNKPFHQPMWHERTISHYACRYCCLVGNVWLVGSLWMLGFLWRAGPCFHQGEFLREIGLRRLWFWMHFAY